MPATRIRRRSSSIARRSRRSSRFRRVWSESAWCHATASSRRSPQTPQRRRTRTISSSTSSAHMSLTAVDPQTGQVRRRLTRLAVRPNTCGASRGRLAAATLLAGVTAGACTPAPHRSPSLPAAGWRGDHPAMAVHDAAPGRGESAATDEKSTGRLGLPIAVLAAAQFVMVLDSSVMNVSISQIVKDLDTTIQGVQLAITAYTLVMAAFMLAGAKLGDILGRDRAFAVGLGIYGLGPLTTALSPNLAVLRVGWSLVEGLGAALVIPAIVSLIAGIYSGKQRALAFGIIGGVAGA